VKMPKCPRCRYRHGIRETTTLFDKRRWFQCPRCGYRFSEGRKK